METLKHVLLPEETEVVFNDSLPQTDEYARFRTHLDTAYIPALGQT